MALPARGSNPRPVHQTQEERALSLAREDYVYGRIDVAQFEAAVELILNRPEESMYHSVGQVRAMHRFQERYSRPRPIQI